MAPSVGVLRFCFSLCSTHMNRMNLKNAVWEMWKNPIFHYLPVDVFRSSDWGSFFIDVLEVKRSLSVGSNLHSCTYPPKKSLTWNLKMMVSKRNLLFQGIFRFYVNLSGCRKGWYSTSFQPKQRQFGADEIISQTSSQKRPSPSWQIHSRKTSI